MAARFGVTAELLDLALRMAHQAGAALADRRGDAGKVTYKTTATDPVSEADQASERLITTALLAERPQDGILGEEGADREGASGLRWIVDPLDGTVNYLYGIPAWSISIACADDDGAVVGVVHQPLTGAVYSAVRGAGSFLDGVRLTVNDPVPLERALVATGFSYDAGDRRRQAAVLASLLPQVRDVRRLGSAALDLCMVAGGMVDAYYEDTTAIWDRAAGALIAAEAGAAVRTYGDGIVAAGRALIDPLCGALHQARQT
ncbi:MAG: inositol monophosphatase [Nitriliruptorales bacterium]|nr:inositol monophosphatase [Nitriliruptorales bacterium]